MDRPTLACRKCALLTALLIGALCAQALAADFQVGVEAIERGDYAAALREFRPLAEQGMAWPRRSPASEPCTIWAWACHGTLLKP